MISDFWAVVTVVATLGAIIMLNKFQLHLVGKEPRETSLPDPGEPDDTMIGDYPRVKFKHINIDPQTLSEFEQAWEKRRQDYVHAVETRTLHPIKISKCPYCNRRVQKDMDNCPGCGAPY